MALFGSYKVPIFPQNFFYQVVQLLLSVEEMPLSIATSRKVILLISRIHMSLSAARIDERYIPVALNGVIGIFYNRFSYLWSPALDCISVLLGQYSGILWDRFVKYLDYCLSIILGHDDQADKGNTESLGKDAGMLHSKSWDFDSVLLVPMI